MQSRRPGLGFTAILFLAFLFLVACGPDAGGSEATVETDRENAANETSSESRKEVPEEDMVRTDTHIIESYETRGMIVERFSTWMLYPSSSFTFEWVGEDFEKVTDVSFSWTGEGECKLRKRSVGCSKGIETLQVSYRRPYTPTVEGDRVTLELEPYHARRIDFSLDLFYPSSLRFVSSKPVPDFEAAGHLRWNRPEMTRFSTQVTFLDVKAVRRRWLRLGALGAGLVALGADAVAIALKRRGRRMAAAMEAERSNDSPEQGR